MSITFNATNYNAADMSINANHQSSGLHLVDSVASASLGYITLNANGTILLSLTNSSSANGLLLRTSSYSANLTIPNVNSVIVNTNKTCVLQNKSLSYTNNTLDVNRIRDIPFIISSLVGTYCTFNGSEWVNTGYQNIGINYDYWVFSDTRSTGTSGGASVSGYGNRIINLIPSQSSSSTDVTNPTTTTFRFNANGVYFVRATSVFAASGGTAKLFVADATTPTTYYIIGMHTFGADVYPVSLMGTITVTTAPLTCVLRYYSANANSQGLGLADNIPGVSEIYTQMYIRKLA